MTKHLIIIILAFALVLPGVSSASEVTGTLNVTTTAPVVVVTEPEVVVPPNRGGGGGGGGGSSNPTPIKGDANKDGRVDIIDFSLLMAQWGRIGQGNSADFNTDGRVDVLDFVILMSSWNK